MKREIWRFRLVQLAPLIVAALMAALWYSFPVEVRQVGVSPLYLFFADSDAVDGFGSPYTQVSVMEALLRVKQGLQPWESAGGDQWPRAIDRMATETAGALFRAEPGLCDDDGVPRSLTAGEQAALFSGVDAFEARFGARVAVFVISSDPEPPVAFASIGDPAILTDEERAEVEGGMTPVSVRRLAPGRSTRNMWVDLSAVNAGAGELRDGRFISVGTMLLDGHLWEWYSITPEGANADFFLTDTWESLQDAGLRQSAETVAESSDGAVIIVGPVDSGAHLIRSAPGSDDDGAAALWALAARTPRLEAMSRPYPLQGDSHAAAGGARLVELAFAGSGAVPRVAVVALYDDHPRVPALWEALGRSPLTVSRVWLGTHLSTVMAVLVVVLALSLVASPLAFRAERIHREEQEAENERLRIQREAELRVVRKLDELSGRVEAVKGQASETTAVSVTGVSEDIDSTVAELRRILGDVAGDGGRDE